MASNESVSQPEERTTLVKEDSQENTTNQVQISRSQEKEPDCRECHSLQMDVEALKGRNKELVDSFVVYREEAERNVAMLEAEIARLNQMVEGQKKEVQTLTDTIAKMTEDLSSKENQVGSLSNMVDDLKDSIEVERTKNSQISSQFMALQFKNAQEKATKTIISTASSISASIKSFSQDLFSRKIDPVVMNTGYKEFITRYEEDMKHVEESMKALSSVSAQITEEWKKSEEAQSQRITELQEENQALREEKTKLESSLRGTIQSLELANEDAKSELTKARVEYKVSDQEENNRRFEKLEEKVKAAEAAGERKAREQEQAAEALREELARLKEELAQQSARAEAAEGRVKALETVDGATQASQATQATQATQAEEKRVLEAMHAWKEDSRRYDAPGFDLSDASVASLFLIWKMDDATRNEVKAWMEAYMRRTEDSAFTEIVLPSMALEVYEGFAQVVVPILQARANSTVRIEQRQSVLYDMRITAGTPPTLAAEGAASVSPTAEGSSPVPQTEDGATAKSTWKWND